MTTPNKMAVNPKYCGLRLIEKGPEVTSCVGFS